MSLNKVQAVLESDRTFAPFLAVKDTDISVRGGQTVKVPEFVFRVGEALKAIGFDPQTAPKNVILATAAGLPATSGAATPAPVTQTVVETPATPAPAPEPPKPKPARSAPPKQVLVKGAKPSEKPAPKQVDPVAQFTDTGAIHRYQCAVASAQLLAALSQLFEKDEWPGADERRKKLDALIDDVEKASTQHVNLSVRQIIRAQAAQKTSREG